MSEPSGLDYVQLALLGEAAAAGAAAVFVWDDDRNYVAVNEAACALVGLSREELLRLRTGDLSPGRAAELVEDVQRRDVSSGRSTFSRSDGAEVEVEWVTFRTRVAGLPYMASVCWPAAE